MTPAINPRLAGVGQRIRTARGRAGMSLSRLALEAGIGKGTLSELEQGTRNPTLETLYAVAGVLEVPLAMLLEPSQAPRLPGSDQPPTAGAGAVVIEDAVVRAELLRAHAVPGGVLAEVYLLTLSPGRRVSPGHGRGVREHLTLLAGAAVVGPEGEAVELGAGESTSWDSSAPHCYETAGGAQGVLIITNPARDHAGR